MPGGGNAALGVPKVSPRRLGQQSPWGAVPGTGHRAAEQKREVGLAPVLLHSPVHPELLGHGNLGPRLGSELAAGLAWLILPFPALCTCREREGLWCREVFRGERGFGVSGVLEMEFWRRNGFGEGKGVLEGERGFRARCFGRGGLWSEGFWKEVF